MFEKQQTNPGLTISTNEKIGQFKLKYVFGDNYWSIPEPFEIREESELIPVRIDTTLVHAANLWKNEEWEKYPNPSKGQVHIRMGTITDEVVLKVYDLNGRIHKSDVLREVQNEFDLSALPKGTYIIALEKNGEVKSKRLIIQ